jgi:NMD protein affecting ribosome stability and mRNA decay
MTEDEPARCRNCGKPLDDDAGYEGTGLCGDCYWDDQTDADGTIGDDE